MGIFKALNNVIKFAENIDGSYEVTCKYCGRSGKGHDLKEAIKMLQSSTGGCGENCHEPIITRRPE